MNAKDTIYDPEKIAKARAQLFDRPGVAMNRMREGITGEAKLGEHTILKDVRGEELLIGGGP